MICVRNAVARSCRSRSMPWIVMTSLWKSPWPVTLPCTIGAQAVTLENVRATRMISAASVMPS